jgi:hypothetical protein
MAVEEMITKCCVSCENAVFMRVYFGTLTKTYVELQYLWLNHPYYILSLFLG